MTPLLEETSLIDDSSDETIALIARKVEASHSWEHQIYRESELDKLYVLLQLALYGRRASAHELDEPSLKESAAATLRAHDLVAEGDMRGAAAALFGLVRARRRLARRT